MRVTKQEHACLIIEDSGKTLVVESGSFTTALVGLNNVVAIVIHHEHADHWTDDQLNRILERNPDARIFAPAGVAAAAPAFEHHGGERRRQREGRALQPAFLR